MWAAGEIDGMIAQAGSPASAGSPGSDALVVRRSYFSQSADASAMEADNGNVWLDRATGTLRMMMATWRPKN